MLPSMRKYREFNIIWIGYLMQNQSILSELHQLQNYEWFKNDKWLNYKLMIKIENNDEMM